MAVQRWSDQIAIVEFSDEPQFSEDVSAFLRLLDDEEGLEPSAVFDLSHVSYLNSSNVAQLLKLRKRLHGAGKSLRLCGVGDPVWGLLMLAGLDKLFQCAPDVGTALASLQLEG
ncbi:MAG: STAS domain-containing protein [Phycisphaerales bacterium]